MIREDPGAFLTSRRPGQQFTQTIAEEDIVAKHHRHTIASDEIGTNNEGVRETGRTGLFRVAEPNAPLAPVL